MTHPSLRVTVPSIVAALLLVVASDGVYGIQQQSTTSPASPAPKHPLAFDTCAIPGGLLGSLVGVECPHPTCTDIRAHTVRQSTRTSGSPGLRRAMRLLNGPSFSLANAATGPGSSGDCIANRTKRTEIHLEDFAGGIPGSRRR